MFFDDACVDFVEVETSLVGFEGLRAGRGGARAGFLFYYYYYYLCG